MQLSVQPQTYFYYISSTGFIGDKTKFALPLAVDILAGIEFLILLLLLCNLLGNHDCEYTVFIFWATLAVSILSSSVG